MNYRPPSVLHSGGGPHVPFNTRGNAMEYLTAVIGVAYRLVDDDSVH